MNDESPHLSLEDLIQGRDGGSREEAHLAGCPTCQAAVREWEQISAAYRVFLGTLEGFRGAFLFRNLERFYLALRLDVVVQCFRTRSCRRNVSANF